MEPKVRTIGNQMFSVVRLTETIANQIPLPNRVKEGLVEHREKELLHVLGSMREFDYNRFA